jgi:hypothetical protein
LPLTECSCSTIEIYPERLAFNDLDVHVATAYKLVVESQVRAAITPDDRVGLVEQANRPITGARFPHLEMKRARNSTSIQKCAHWSCMAEQERSPVDWLPD